MLHVCAIPEYTWVIIVFHIHMYMYHMSTKLRWHSGELMIFMIIDC